MHGNGVMPLLRYRITLENGAKATDRQLRISTRVYVKANQTQCKSDSAVRRENRITILGSGGRSSQRVPGAEQVLTLTGSVCLLRADRETVGTEAARPILYVLSCRRDSIIRVYQRFLFFATFIHSTPKAVTSGLFWMLTHTPYRNEM